MRTSSVVHSFALVALSFFYFEFAASLLVDSKGLNLSFSYRLSLTILQLVAVLIPKSTNGVWVTMPTHRRLGLTPRLSQSGVGRNAPSSLLAQDPLFRLPGRALLFLRRTSPDSQADFPILGPNALKHKHCTPARPVRRLYSQSEAHLVRLDQHHQMVAM